MSDNVQQQQQHIILFYKYHALSPDPAVTEDYRAAVKALDRTLVSGRYIIPIWHQPIARLAHVKELRYSQNLPMYGDWIGFQPDVWWYEE